MGLQPNNRSQNGAGFRLDEGFDPDVKPVERQDLLELMGERQVSVVERLTPVTSRQRVGRSRRAGGSLAQVRDPLTFSGSWTDVAIDVISRVDELVDIRGVVLPGKRVDLGGVDSDYLDNCIANLWSRPTHSQTVSQLGRFDFRGVSAGPAELAISCGGRLLLADLMIE